MSKRIPELDPGTPTSDDKVPFYDVATDTTKYALIEDLVPSINGLLFKVLSANASGADSLSAQPWFPSAGAVAVEGSTTYFFEGYLRTSRAAGAVSHTTSLLFAGTATLTGIAYEALVNSGDVVTNAAANKTSAEVATATVVKGASTSTTEQIAIYVRGTVRVNAGGTLIPQFQYSAAPGGAPSVLANTFFRLYPVGSNAVTTAGTWS